jgi:putative intracellular protease/amidase
MKISYVLYPDFTGLDLVGPYEVISRWPDAEVHFVASSLDAVRLGSRVRRSRDPARGSGRVDTLVSG